MAASSGSDQMMKLENTEKRDALIEIQNKYQAQWQREKLFERKANAPTTAEIPFGSVSHEELHKKHPKAFMIFAFPYMNGSLHVGHSFTVRYHCTGMPIKACADKLIAEVKKFGRNFEKYDAEEDEDVFPAPTQAQTKEDVTKFTAKKGKANAKTIKAKYQFQIMLSQGIPREELHKFADPAYWLEYFPPLCRRDLNGFGARIDWRRQFVTTDANPYFDTFVRWQMNRLRELNKIQFGSRYTIFSPKDGQPCMDHDRSDGEGVIPQEYTALKLKVKEWSDKAADLIRTKIPQNANIYFIAATLRPETMYGQNSVFVGPGITYGIFEASEGEYYVFTKRAAWNLAFQGVFFQEGNFARNQSELTSVLEFPGSAVIGTLVDAPLSIHTQGVRILPMESVLATKGTGVVTSVPSDSPDDFATIRELAKKADYYGIQKEWAELEIRPIINTPSYGDVCAKFLVQEMKINSPKDTKLLAEAKDLAYKEGYYKGKMLIGEFKGESVESAKPKVRDVLIRASQAFPYAEPGGRVVSRSGDECVVAYLGQWFLNYGDQDTEWKSQVLDHLHSPDLQLYASETRHGFEGVLDWLNKWACARTYGLGSKLPWDTAKGFLVESLSDSTIYMAYYTMCHFLHNDLFGKERGIFDIKPKQMTDETWDYIFARTDVIEHTVQKSGIKQSELETLRREFEYWYPLDLSVSGKDLIPNHLTFFLYIHCALFPKRFWPRSIRANGHLLLNGEKMSKSTGNFLTLSEAVKKFGADATRIALADAGDAVEDANFDESVANTSILRLYTLKEWCEEVMTDGANLRQSHEEVFFDKLFENEMNSLVHEAYAHYAATNYKAALKSGLYDFMSARDFYRESTTAMGIGMQAGLVARYIELQALVLTPIAPHWCDYIWSEVLKRPESVQLAAWPIVGETSPSLSAAREYVRATSSSITSAEAAQLKKKQKGKTIAFDPKLPKKLSIFAAKAFPAWQEKYIQMVKDFQESDLKDDKELVAKVGKMGEAKKAMPFIQNLKTRLKGGESASVVFERKLTFDEAAVLAEMVTGLKKFTGCKIIEVLVVDEGGKAGEIVVGEGRGQRKEGLSQTAENAVPGKPSFYFENVDV